MPVLRVCILLVLLPLVSSLAQPIAYSSRGARTYLVNYGAIGGNRFLAWLAARRFALVDEGGRTDIALMHAESPGMPVLHYRDMVALHASFAEYDTVSRDEHAFLHSGDPATLSLFLRGDTAEICWMHDRRPLNIAGYRIFFSLDSLDAPHPLSDTLVRGTSLRARLPKSASWLSISTQLADGTMLVYGRPVRIASAKRGEPSLAAAEIAFTRSGAAPRDAVLAVTLRSIGDVEADSVVLFCDTNRDNSFNYQSERFRMNSSRGTYTATLTVPEGDRNLGGYECMAYAFSGNARVRFPAAGSFSSTVNNRLMNDYYGFYVMDVGRRSWREASIAAILNAFARDGYNGLFEDDTWYRVERWGCDAYPPAAYSDSAWQLGMYGLLDSIKAAIHPRPAYFNGLYAARSDSLLLHADGGMTEGFAYTHWSAYVTGTYWRELCDVGLRCQHQFGKTWLALGGAPANDPDARLYALGSYLLLADSLSQYANATSYQEFSHFPEFDIPLGKPLHGARASIDELRRAPSGNEAALYIREFEHGTVVVNSDPAKSATYAAAAGRRAIMVDSGTTVDGGRLFTVPATATIPPKRSAIILNSAAVELSSPQIHTVEFVPPAVHSDGTTIGRIRVLASDVSDGEFRADPRTPLHVRAELGHLGGPKQLVLLNDGSAATAVPSWYEGFFTLPVGASPRSASVPVAVFSSTGLFAVARQDIRIVSSDSTNLVLNFSFEIDDNGDGVPDLWRSYVKGFDYDTAGHNAKTGRRSVHARNDSTSESRGVYCSIDLNQTIPQDLELSGWSKAAGVSGSKDNDYSLYVDVQYTDGTSLYGQCAQFTPGTHDWEHAVKIIQPAKPIRRVSLYALLRRHTGEAWFDHIALRPSTSPSGMSEIPYAPIPLSLAPPSPNPAGETVSFRFTLARESRLHLRLIDALGRIVLERPETVFSAGAHEISVSIAALCRGLYTCEFVTDDGVRRSARLIKH